MEILPRFGEHCTDALLWKLGIDAEFVYQINSPVLSYRSCIDYRLVYIVYIGFNKYVYNSVKTVDRFGMQPCIRDPGRLTVD